MKRIFSFLVAAFILTTILLMFSISATAELASKDAMGGYENLVLTYTHNPNRQDMGRHTPEDLKPYVAYYDTEGNIVDFFFDSYLFLPCMSYGPSSARLHYDPENPTKAIDWTTYVEDTFHEGTNVDALEIAFGEAKQKLNDVDRKAGVVLSVLYPGVDAGANFGSLGGKSLDFTKMEDRKYAIKWIIDEQMKLFKESDYEHLDLIGFYWLEEYLYSGNQGEIDKELFKYASDYLHSLGLKFVWIPWFRASGYAQWKDLGFDAVTMQPNLYWMKTPEARRIDVCISDCIKYGMGMEIEIDGNALVSGEYLNRYLDYLEAGMKKGAMDSIKMYYQDGKSAVFYNACYSMDERARSVYDLTYKYAKGTLTQADLDARRSEVFALDDDVDWISIGKEYKATKPYSDGSSIGYQQNNGKELTDGIIGQSELDTEWHAYHKSNLDKDKRMSVTVDLGFLRNDLTHFMIHFSHIENYGIDDPADDIKIYISEDGENYTLLAEPKLEYVDVTSYVRYECMPVSARYVKYSFINSNANFVFCSEALVGVGDPSKMPDISVSDTSESDSITSEESVVSWNDEIITSNNSDNTNTVIIIGCVILIVISAVAIIIALTANKKKN